VREFLSQTGSTVRSFTSWFGNAREARFVTDAIPPAPARIITDTAPASVARVNVVDDVTGSLDDIARNTAAIVPERTWSQVWQNASVVRIPTPIASVPRAESVALSRQLTAAQAERTMAAIQEHTIAAARAFRNVDESVPTSEFLRGARFSVSEQREILDDALTGIAKAGIDDTTKIAAVRAVRQHLDDLAAIETASKVNPTPLQRIERALTNPEDELGAALNRSVSENPRVIERPAEALIDEPIAMSRFMQRADDATPSAPPTSNAGIADDVAGAPRQTTMAADEPIVLTNPLPDAALAVIPNTSRSFFGRVADRTRAARDRVASFFRPAPRAVATTPASTRAVTPTPSSGLAIGDVIRPSAISSEDAIRTYQARNLLTQTPSQSSLVGRTAAWTAKKCLQRKIWVVCSALATYVGYAGYGNLSDFVSDFESSPASLSPQSTQANAGGSGGTQPPKPPVVGGGDADRETPGDGPGDGPGPDTNTGTSDDSGVTGSELDSTGTGSGGGFDLGAFSSLFSQLMKYFTQSAEEKEKEEAKKRAAEERANAGREIVAAIIADPNVVEKNATTTLIWSSSGIATGAQVCAIIDSEFKTLRRGNTSGQLSSPKIASSTRFGVICHTRGTKALGETVVRVKGDATVPPRLFSVHSASNYSIDNGEVTGSSGGSTSGGAGGSGGAGAGGESGNPAPEDIRTCDPELPMDEFIGCLCQVEPNPKGCAIPPGGLPDPRI
jgi:hypothetical protein